jgi:hypothetical protein
VRSAGVVMTDTDLINLPFSTPHSSCPQPRKTLNYLHKMLAPSAGSAVK